jgi:hypothetical protein
MKILSISKVKHPNMGRNGFDHCLQGLVEILGKEVSFRVVYYKDDGSIKKDVGKVNAHLSLIHKENPKWVASSKTEVTSLYDCPKCEQTSLKPFIPYIKEATGRPVVNGWGLVNAVVPARFAKNLGSERRGEEVAIVYYQYIGNCPVHGLVKIQDYDVMD